MPTYMIEPAHTQAAFSVRHLMITTVRGNFDKLSGTLQYDPANPEASVVEVAIDAASINTGVADRDNHLRSADFLDAATYPTLTFKSTSVKMTGTDTADITGDLTIRGVTRPVVIKAEKLGEAKDPWGNTKIGFAGKTKINREDWGLTWNVALETGGILVGKEVTIELDVQVVPVQAAQTA